MNKEGKTSDFFGHLKDFWKSFKRSYLYRLISKFLSACFTVILVLLLVVGGLMFFFNMKGNAAKKQGLDYTPPFGLYTIISPSMEPNVEVYDVIIAVDQDVSKIKVGDIITFISNWDINYGMTVTHRVIEVSKNENGEFQLTTKGDNNNSPDGGKVTQNNLVGKVVGRLPQLGKLQFFLATKMGWFMVIFIPALIVIILDMIKIFKLYVLKEEITNVKTHKEAKKEEVEKVLDQKYTVLPTTNKELLAPRKIEEKDDTIELPKIDKVIDETIDTVELPKIDLDGKITTGELPVIKGVDIPKEEIVTMPQVKKEKTIPLLNRKPIERKSIQRKMLKRRK